MILDTHHVWGTRSDSFRDTLHGSIQSLQARHKGAKIEVQYGVAWRDDGQPYYTALLVVRK